MSNEDDSLDFLKEMGEGVDSSNTAESGAECAILKCINIATAHLLVTFIDKNGVKKELKISICAFHANMTDLIERPMKRWAIDKMWELTK